MTKDEFKQAFAIAQREKNMIDVDTVILEGCGLPGFKSVYCTLRQVAALIRWQAALLSGEWDSKELDSIASIARRKFQIIG